MIRCFQIMILLLLVATASHSLNLRETWIKDSTRIANLRIEYRKEMPDSQRLEVYFSLTESEKYSVPDSSEAHNSC